MKTNLWSFGTIDLSSLKDLEEIIIIACIIFIISCILCLIVPVYSLMPILVATVIISLCVLMGSSIIYIIKGSSLQNEQNENNIYQAIKTNYENIEEYELFGFKGTFKNEGVLYRFYTDDNKLYIREGKSNKVCKIIDGE